MNGSSRIGVYDSPYPMLFRVCIITTVVVGYIYIAPAQLCVIEAQTEPSLYQ